MDNLPDTIGPWTLGEANEYNLPELGYSVEYHLDEDAWATIYFYDGGMIPRAEGFTYEQILAQMERAKEDIYNSHFADTWRSIEHIDDYPMILDNKIVGLLSAFQLETPEGEWLNSLIYLSSTEEQFIKIRFSYPADRNPDTMEAAELLISWTLSLAPPKCFKVH